MPQTLIRPTTREGATVTAQDIIREMEDMGYQADADAWDDYLKAADGIDRKDILADMRKDLTRMRRDLRDDAF